METLVLILFFVAATTLADIFGAGLVALRQWPQAASRVLIAFAVGVMATLALLHLLPEALELGEETGFATEQLLVLVALGLFFAFVFERVVAWYHCHGEACPIHRAVPARRATLFAGATFEEFIDGVTIALATIAGGWPLGALTSIAVFAHELPETAAKTIAFTTFGASRKKAVVLVMLTTLGAFSGALISGIGLPFVAIYQAPLLAFAAGTFLYIATADLIPELHSFVLRRWFFLELSLVLLGALLIWWLGEAFPEPGHL